MLLPLVPLPFFLFQETIIIPLDGFRARMLRSKGSCIDRQCALVERLGLLVLALTLVEQSQVVEAACRVGMHLAQLLLIDRQRALVERLGLLVLALRPVEVRQCERVPCGVEMLGFLCLRAHRIGLR